MDEDDDAWSLPLPRLTEPQETSVKEEDIACPALAVEVQPSFSDSLEMEEVPAEARNKVDDEVQSFQEEALDEPVVLAVSPEMEEASSETQNEEDGDQRPPEPMGECDEEKEKEEETSPMFDQEETGPLPDSSEKEEVPTEEDRDQSFPEEALDEPAIIAVSPEMEEASSETQNEEDGDQRHLEPMGECAEEQEKEEKEEETSPMFDREEISPLPDSLEMEEVPAEARNKVDDEVQSFQEEALDEPAVLAVSPEMEEASPETQNKEEGDQRHPEPMGDCDEEKEEEEEELETSAMFDREEIGPLPGKKAPSPLCKWFCHLNPTMAELFADIAAQRDLELILDHYLESPQRTCDKLLIEVITSSFCDLEHALLYLMAEVKESFWLRKLRAMKAIEVISDVITDDDILEPWVPFVSKALLSVTRECILNAETHKELQEELCHSINALLDKYMPNIEALLEVTRWGIQCQRSRMEDIWAV